MSANAYAFVTIVSGLPRSGTSVMMQMLAAGGIPVLVDDQRKADVDNPRGYFELETVKMTGQDQAWLNRAEGHAVKVIHSLVPQLPNDRDYRVLFMQRDLDEVLASQRKMLDRLGRKGAAISDAQLKQVYQNQLGNLMRWFAERERFRLLPVEYSGLIADPAITARLVNDFLGGGLNESAMIGAVDPSLYRNKSS